MTKEMINGKIVAILLFWEEITARLAKNML